MTWKLELKKMTLAPSHGQTASTTVSTCPTSWIHFVFIRLNSSLHNVFFSLYGQHTGWDICQCIQLLGSWSECGCFIQQTASSISPCALHPTAGLPACQFHPQHPLTNVFTIWPLDVSKLSGFISKCLRCTCPSDVLIPNAILVTPRENLCLLLCHLHLCRLSFPQRRRLWAVQDRSRSLSLNLSFHSCRDCRRDVTPVVFSSTRSNLLAHALRGSGMLTLGTSNPPRSFIRAPCHRISARECELNQTLKLKWATWLTLGLMGQTNVTHQRSAQVVGSPVQGSNGGVEDNGCMFATCRAAWCIRGDRLLNIHSTQIYAWFD